MPATLSSKARSRVKKAAPILLALLGACAREAERPDTPSGQPVPRWVSTRSGTVNARVGPGNDYAVAWQYRVRGLPIQVVGETREWRRVCDPDGTVAWVAATRTSGRRTAIGGAGETPLLAQPRTGARVVARLAPRALADVGRCEDGWCRLSAGRVRGWVLQGTLFGTASAKGCTGATVGRPPR